ncbi:MAG: extracellular solute-binding protein [Chloroflexi bacterium]|nr:extracellular solute-binding protein [Chloroflexota bacterium]
MILRRTDVAQRVIGGRIAVLPLSGSVSFVLYDSALFQAAGVDKPGPGWTWTQFVEAGKRLTRTGEREQWGTMAANSIPLLLSLIWAHGGELVNKEGRRSPLAEPAARQGIQFWADLMQRHRIAPLPGPGQNLQPNWTQREMWFFTPQPGQPIVIGDSSTAGNNPRLATMFSTSVPSLFGGMAQGPRTIQLADVPKAAHRGTQFSLSAALVVGTKAGDPRLALRAGMALADHLLQSPVGGFGYPVRKPEAALLRRMQPRLAEEDAEVIASAFTYSRGVPPELTQRIFPALSGKLMQPIQRGQATPDEAARAAAAALDEALR